MEIDISKDQMNELLGLFDKYEQQVWEEMGTLGVSGSRPALSPNFENDVFKKLVIETITRRGF